MQKVHEIQDDLAIISMISDERTIFLCLSIVAIIDNFGIFEFHHEMLKVGVVNHLRMRIVHDLVKFPPPLIALYPSLPW